MTGPVDRSSVQSQTKLTETSITAGPPAQPKLSSNTVIARLQMKRMAAAEQKKTESASTPQTESKPAEAPAKEAVVKENPGPPAKELKQTMSKVQEQPADVFIPTTAMKRTALKKQAARTDLRGTEKKTETASTEKAASAPSIREAPKTQHPAIKSRADAQSALELAGKKKIEVQRELYTDFTSGTSKIEAALVGQVPDVKVNPQKKVGKPPVTKNLNNYGLAVDKAFQDKESGKLKLVLGQKTIECTGKPLVKKEGKKTVVYAAEKTAVNCDKPYATEHKKSSQTMAFSDGCSWGEDPANAADKASRKAVEVVDRAMKSGEVQNLKDVSRLHLQAFREAQKEIVDSVEQNTDSGTTTLSLATVVDGYALITLVGDSKVFIIRNEGGKETCFEPTAGSRGSDDPKDPGGRLGKQVKLQGEKDSYGTAADLRNLQQITVELKTGDKILVCSDGIHDNLNPHQLGEEPMQYGFQTKEWTPELTEQAMSQKLLKLVGGSTSLQEMGDKIEGHISQTTTASKLHNLETGTEPTGGYKRYPGKSDHAGQILFEYNPD